VVVYDDDFFYFLLLLLLLLSFSSAFYMQEVVDLIDIRVCAIDSTFILSTPRLPFFPFSFFLLLFYSSPF